ncbi:MAG: class I SAM-dependent methyltransferase [Candidatus Eisenbacteria bacterium]|nr:class I SAM-dependent methyltransferase [Candidatus Eisenbacteria bacterium]
MRILDVIRRTTPPAPWSEAENIPWSDPAFSSRMLAEHLSEHHDRASRRPAVIDRHVDWIHDVVLTRRPSRILDLCCGPGLYTSRLAERGHSCTGIDYSPASLEYAREQARERSLDCCYELSDVRRADFGSGFDLVMMIFGEFNVFRRDEVETILRRAHGVLNPGGALLLEPQTLDAVRETGESPPSWFASERDLFSESPHLVLQESFWDPGAGTATVRYYVVDAGGDVERMSATYQGYSNEEYAGMLTSSGFEGADFIDSLAGAGDDSQVELFAVLARKE